MICLYLALLVIHLPEQHRAVASSASSLSTLGSHEIDGLVYVFAIACFSAHLTLTLTEIAAAEETTELNYCDAINDALRIALKTDDSAVRDRKNQPNPDLGNFL